MLTNKPEVVVESPSEPPALPHIEPCPGPPKPEHYYQHAADLAYEADYGTAHFLIQPVHQCVCYNSGLDVGLNESVHDCMNMPPAEPQPSEEVLWLTVFPS